MESIIIHPKNKEQASLFEQLAKTLKVPFEKAKKTGKPYSPDFVAKIENSRKDYKEGRGSEITLKKLFCLFYTIQRFKTELPFEG